MQLIDRNCPYFMPTINEFNGLTHENAATFTELKIHGTNGRVLLFSVLLVNQQLHLLSGIMTTIMKVKRQDTGVIAYVTMNGDMPAKLSSPVRR